MELTQKAARWVFILSFKARSVLHMDLGTRSVGKGMDRYLQLLRFWGKDIPCFEVKNRVFF